MNNIILAITLVVAFFMCIKAYTLGLKHGKQLSLSIVPKFGLNPIREFKQVTIQREETKEQTKISNELDEVMGATRESMLNSIKGR